MNHKIYYFTLGLVLAFGASAISSENGRITRGQKSQGSETTSRVFEEKRIADLNSGKKVQLTLTREGVKDLDGKDKWRVTTKASAAELGSSFAGCVGGVCEHNGYASSLEDVEKVFAEAIKIFTVDAEKKKEEEKKIANKDSKKKPCNVVETDENTAEKIQDCISTEYRNLLSQDKKMAAADLLNEHEEMISQWLGGSEEQKRAAKSLLREMRTSMRKDHRIIADSIEAKHYDSLLKKKEKNIEIMTSKLLRTAIDPMTRGSANHMYLATMGQINREQSALYDIQSRGNQLYSKIYNTYVSDPSLNEDIIAPFENSSLSMDPGSFSNLRGSIMNTFNEQFNAAVSGKIGSTLLGNTIDSGGFGRRLRTTVEQSDGIPDVPYPFFFQAGVETLNNYGLPTMPANGFRGQTGNPAVDNPAGGRNPFRT